MSISVQTAIWKHSKQKGTCLLILLAIGDFANDEGVAFPSVKTLAGKARISERGTQYLLQRLTRSRELVIERGAGPKGCNLFRVQILHQGCNDLAPVQTVQGEAAFVGGCKNTYEGGAIAVAPEPSMNHQRTIKKKKNTAPTDPRRAPLVDFMFQTFTARYGELVPDSSDFSALKTLLGKTKAELPEIERRWMVFLDSENQFHRDQGHPVRFFCSNYTAFNERKANGNGRHKTKEDLNREAGQRLLSRLDSQDLGRDERGDF